jgi:rSAM/selenodomain-associated transferase 1
VTQSALIIVAKEPVPGQTKTRLCPPFSLESAAAFYRCLLLDSLALMSRLETADHVIAYAPSNARNYFARLKPNSFSLVAQVGDNLGERLANALDHHFDQGYQRVAIMNSDGPTLPLDYLEQAFSGLDHADVTMGPGHDGGYYLIGMNRLHRELFEGIDWSTEHVISQTLATGRRLGLAVHQLPEWYDVDLAEDLERLRRDLKEEPERALHTWDFLRGLD